MAYETSRAMELFIEQCVIREPGRRQLIPAVKECYADWCKREREFNEGYKALCAALDWAGYPRKRTGAQRYFKGIRLAPRGDAVALREAMPVMREAADWVQAIATDEAKPPQRGWVTGKGWVPG